MLPEGPLFHKPNSIIAAMNILYATLFLGVINWAVGQWGTTGSVGSVGSAGSVGTAVHPISPIEGVVILLVTLGLVFWLIKMIGQGKKWARVVVLVLFLLGLLAYPWALMALFKSNLLLGVLSVLQTLLQITALVYLFSRVSTQWFNHVHSFEENEA